MNTLISEIKAREILDSRGYPTVEACVLLTDGIIGVASVPSGASTGKHEAVELRDGDRKRYNGKGVLKAIDNIVRCIAPALQGRDPFCQKEIDQRIMELDGTPTKMNLGANATLGVSLAVARAAAAARAMPLYQYLSDGNDVSLPVPMFNVLNGGRHAHDSSDFQEFMIVPSGVPTYNQALRAGAEIYQMLKLLLMEKGYSTNVGDEGGFAPSLPSNREALDIMLESINRAGYEAGVEVFLGIDAAASELYDSGVYHLTKEGLKLNSQSLVEYYGQWISSYPIVSIEDGMAEDDWDGWLLLEKEAEGRIQLVGDDLYATSKARLERGIRMKASNAILIKPNQIGTLTETLTVLNLAKSVGWGTIISHRSGETEDTTIADLAVAWNAGQIKTGAPCRSERVAKYNRLLKIESDLGHAATYAGNDTFPVRKFLEPK